jgi:hypothetical protein
MRSTSTWLPSRQVMRSTWLLAPGSWGQVELLGAGYTGQVLDRAHRGRPSSLLQQLWLRISNPIRRTVDGLD